MFISKLLNRVDKFIKTKRFMADMDKRSIKNPEHHWIFDEFSAFNGEVPTNYHVAYIGDRVRDDTVDWEGGRTELLAIPSMPPFDEEYFEWIDILSSVKGSGENFTMLELGAGYGRWTARAAYAARQLGKSCYFGLAEAEPKNQKLLKTHMENNQILPNQYKLYGIAVSDSEGECLFKIGLSETEALLKTKNWFGQEIQPVNANELKYTGELYFGIPKMYSSDGSGYISVKKHTLSNLLSDYKYIDIIDMDIQGEEGRVVKESIGQLTSKVNRLHIGTHSHEIEEELRSVLSPNGWICIRDYSCGQTNKTEFGDMPFVDGVQSWINDKYI